MNFDDELLLRLGLVEIFTASLLDKLIEVNVNVLYTK